jgi:hypothetical protein
MDQYLLLSFKDDYAEVVETGNEKEMSSAFDSLAIDWDSSDTLLMVKVVKSAEPILDIKDWGDDEVRPAAEKSEAAIGFC